MTGAVIEREESTLTTMVTQWSPIGPFIGHRRRVVKRQDEGQHRGQRDFN